MAAVKPEVVVSREREGISTTFLRLPPHFPPRPIHQSHCRHRPTCTATLFRHDGHETGSRLHLRNRKSYRRDSNGYSHIFHHAQYANVTGDVSRQLLLPYINFVDTKPEVDCISETGRAIDVIPTATPTFSTTPQFTKVNGDNVQQLHEPQNCICISFRRIVITTSGSVVENSCRTIQNFVSVDVPLDLACTKTYILTPKLHFYLVPAHSNNYFRFRGRRASRYGEFVLKYTELHVGRCSVGFFVHENLYLDTKIAFLSRTDA
jgi:hypothetical protein